ncbi:MAG: rhombosortase [Gammaproteobacteria bacterium]|nr:rhombosortase [Gammaproteobacteria bacterium]
MIQLPLERQYLVPAAMMSLLLVLFYSLPASVHELLSYQRDLIRSGEWWRLVSGQLLHFELSHLALNIAGIWVMYLLFAEHAPSWRYGALVLSLVMLIGIAIFFFARELDYYVGFSAVLYGIFAWGACLDIQRKIRLGYLLLVGMVLKVSWEMWQGPVSFGAADTSQLAVAAHFWGVASGIIVALAWILGRFYRQHKCHSRHAAE